jgi:hypothetical protein
MDRRDTSQGTRAKKTRKERPALGKQSVNARPLVTAGKFLIKMLLFFSSIIIIILK